MVRGSPRTPDKPANRSSKAADASTPAITTTAPLAKAPVPDFGEGLNKVESRTTLVHVDTRTLGTDLRPEPFGGLTKKEKNALFATAGSFALQPSNFARLTYRSPWIENVARLSGSSVSVRANYDDYLLSSTDINKGFYPSLGVYFEVHTPGIPILIAYVVNALKPISVRVGTGNLESITSLTAGPNYLTVVLNPTSKGTGSSWLLCEPSNHKGGVLEVKAVELTTLK